MRNLVKEVRFVKAFEGVWKMKVFNDGKINIQYIALIGGSESRVYQLNHLVESVEQEHEYVFINMKDGNQLQFKFEEFGFLVGDLYDNDGMFIDTFACHVFLEEDIQYPELEPF